jgi:membrane fusion protein, multidrug efflux system
MTTDVPHPHRRGAWRACARAVLTAAALAAAVACSEGRAATAGAAGGRGAGAAPVTVMAGPVIVKPMASNVRVVGNVEASSTVDVRSQVTGELLAVHFTEGQDVALGDLLFTIDPRPFEGALKQAEATLARDTAQAQNADAQLVRSTDLLARGLVAQSTHDVLVAQAAALHASLDADAAQVETARVQLQHTRIIAPMAGRTGALLVHPGAIVRTTDASPLVVINRIAPVYVSFAVPARLLSELQGDRARRALRVAAAPAGSGSAVVDGTVTFVDNAVDQSTDTIRLKASFANDDRRLWPGAFVDVTLRLSVTPDALVVPTAAVQAGQGGQMVYVVTPEGTAEARPVTIAWTEGNESVVASGLSAGETVVTDGQLRLAPGVPVTLQAAGVAEGGGR